MSVQVAKVDTEPQAAILFLHQHHCIAPSVWLGLIAPDSSISLRWFQTSSTNGGVICLNCSLKGVSSITFIICSMEWVQPNSTGSNENTCHGTLPEAGGQHLPALGPRNSSHLSPIHQTIYHVFA